MKDKVNKGEETPLYIAKGPSFFIKFPNTFPIDVLDSEDYILTLIVSKGYPIKAHATPAAHPDKKSLLNIKNFSIALGSDFYYILF